MNKDSLLYWYPKIKDLPIPQPKTLWVVIDRAEWVSALYGKNKIREEKITEIYNTARKIGYPLFLRTDHASGKHEWKDTCYVPSEDQLIPHVFRVIEFNELADILGLPYKALVFREFIELDWKFKAFWGEMPVSRERRYFIKDGKVLCHHPYWVEDAIRKPSIENWRELLKELNTETTDEIEILTGYAEMVARVLDGYWSVDFAYGKNGKWYLIDMATGEHSWHPECKVKEASE